MVSHLRKIPEIILLGNSSQNIKRLAVFSFLVRHPRGTFLHHNFICAVLNDVFGIQARGGCACAGPYAQDLLGIDQDLAAKYESVLVEDSRLDRHHLRRKEEHSAYEMLRPGFSRLSLPYFINDSDLAFIMEAVKMVATEGWKLLPQYILNPETGEWRHHTNSVFRDRKWLGAIRYIDGKMTFNERKVSGVSTCPLDHNECLQVARNTFNKARKMAQRYPLADQCVMFDDATNHLRWFMLPSEAQDLLLGNCCNVKTTLPFSPSQYIGSRGDCTSPVIDIPNAQLFSSRHMSLSGLDNRPDIKYRRPRSDSHSPSKPQQTLKPNMLSPRERCYSLGGATLPKLPVPLRKRQISCSSQTDGLDIGSDHDSTFGESDSRGATPPIVVTTNNPEHLQAYVHEVTKELATEIKSEIREVISQVEDVLCDSSDSSENTVRCNSFSSLSPSMINSVNSQFKPISPVFPINNERVCGSPNSSVTADHVAEYLAELTTEMVSEMKSEIREMVNAVDELISPSSDSARTPSPECDKKDKLDGDLVTDVIINEGLNSITEGLEDCCKLKFKESRRSTVNSLSSQDSGINMNYCEKDVTEKRNKFKKQNCNQKTDKTCKLLEKTEKQVDKENVELTKVRWHCPPKPIWKPMMEAIKEHNMIEDGDRVLICLSGGKDSLSLLHSLHQYQFYAKSKGINFTIGAATVDPGSTAYNPRPLIPYLEALGVHYMYEEQAILESAAEVECTSVCSFCSRMKRGRLYATARREGYNVLALGQHLDDLAESFLMSTFHNGRLRSMKANYYVRERDLRVIRPFVYVREHMLRKFAETKGLPVIPENCPACFEAPKERHRIKQLLAKEEIQFKNIFLSLRSALKPIISFRATGEESKEYRRLTHLVDSESEEELVSASSDSK
uniref:tRNA(Ile)-lysidine/2-thiocytidine synthase N-terminal domain-containing protein n=1 Tax=Clastoptera arizonana TaxID=38151 RepID=A0A1B6C4J5_9HEMI